MENKELSYEEGIRLLQELLDQLEKDDLKLDQTMEKFKEAMKIYDHCNQILTEAEGEVKMILEKEDSLEEIDFPGMMEDEDDKF